MHGEFLSSVFPVKKKDRGNRAVMNLKGLNNYVSYQHFRMEGLYLLKHLVQTGDWMIKIDLKDAHFTVPVSKHYQPLLRFMHGSLRYQFSCLSFGLGPTPRLFTKLFKPVVALLSKETGSETDHLPRRHYCFHSVSGGHCEGQTLTSLAAPSFRLCNQL